tara:strand:+ start:145 stop:492 length:348 start_codon:yes stop_codon:yes gene_type:complete
VFIKEEKSLLYRVVEPTVIATTKLQVVIPKYNLGKYSLILKLKIIDHSIDIRDIVKRMVSTCHTGPSFVRLYFNFMSRYGNFSQKFLFFQDKNKSLKKLGFSYKKILFVIVKMFI